MKTSSIIIIILIVFAMAISYISIPVYADPITGSVLGDWLLAGVVGGAAWDYVKQSVTAFYNEIVYDGNPPHPNCDHDWQLIGFGGSQNGTSYNTFRCSICGDVANVERETLNQAYDDYVGTLTYTYVGNTISLKYHASQSILNAANMALNDVPFGGAKWHCTITNLVSSDNQYSFVLNTSHKDSATYYFWFNGRWCDSTTYKDWFYTDSFTANPGNYNIQVPAITGTHIKWDLFQVQKYNNETELWESVSDKSISPSGTSSAPKNYNSNSNTYSLNLLSGETYRLAVRCVFTSLTSSSASTYSGYTLGVNFGESVITYSGSSNIEQSLDRPTYIPLCLSEDDEASNVYENCVIINESDGVYYNPSTDTSEDITNWSYDYRTRTYDLTTDSGTNVTVTYGNNNLIVNEGNTTYTYYYVIQQGQGCQHEYVGDPENPPIYPTCTTAGMVNYVCSLCGQTRFDLVPALGHDWQYVETVSAEYDDNEELITDAYELYQCSRCGEEKQVEVSEGPQTSSDLESWKNWNWLKQWLNDFKSWLGDKLDALLGKETDVNVNIENHTVTVVDQNGEEQEIDIPDIISRFGWFRDVWGLGTYFVQTVAANEQAAYNYDEEAELMESGIGTGQPRGAPSIKVNLAAANSHYGYEYGLGEVEVLDLSWYTPYKQTVDSLISGFLWLLLLWNLFKHAPGIMGGVGLTSNRVDDLNAGGKRKGG